MTTLKIRNETNTAWIEFPKFDPTLTIAAGSYMLGGGDLSADRVLSWNAAAVDTDDIAEGATNLYFTDARAVNAIEAATAATITGAWRFRQNISVDDGVTFDGRDVSADGAKLDGIEAGATADQTITAGSGLVGGGTGDVTLHVGAGDGITLTADAVAVDSTVVRTARTLTAGSYLSGGGDLSADRTFNFEPGTVSHTLLLDIGANTHADIDNHIAATDNPHNVTATQVGKDTAQWNASKLQGYAVASTAPTDGYALKWNDGASQWEPGPVVTQLSGLSDVGSVSYTAGYVLRADGTDFDAAQLQHGDLGGVGASDHHDYPIPTAGLADDAVTVDKLAHNIDANAIGLYAYGIKTRIDTNEDWSAPSSGWNYRNRGYIGTLSGGGSGQFAVAWRWDVNNATALEHIHVHQTEIKRTSGSGYTELLCYGGGAADTIVGDLVEGIEVFARDWVGDTTGDCTIQTAVFTVGKKAASNTYKSYAIVTNIDAGTQTGTYAPDAFLHDEGTWKYGIDFSGTYTQAALKFKGGANVVFDFDSNDYMTFHYADDKWVWTLGGTWRWAVSTTEVAANVIGNFTAGGVQVKNRSMGSWPTTSDMADGEIAAIWNTSTGSERLYIRHGSTMWYVNLSS